MGILKATRNLVKCLLAFSLASCENPEDFGPINLDSQEDTIANAIHTLPELWVVNEGNFGWGANASISKINLQTLEVNNTYFEQLNVGALGDVAHSISFHDSLAFVVVNNSSKVEIFNYISANHHDRLLNLTSPRQVVHLQNSFWVSDLYSKSLKRVNRLSLNTDLEIQTNDWNEHLVKHNNLILTTNVNRGELIAIDTFGAIVNTLALKSQCLGVFAVNTEHVLCLTQNPDFSQPMLHLVNTSTWTVKSELPLNGGFPVLGVQFFKGSVYWLSNNAIYKSTLNADSLQSIELKLPLPTENAYNLLVNDSGLFVADAKDYLQSGEVLYYSPNGAFKHTFKVGIIPGAMALK